MVLEKLLETRAVLFGRAHNNEGGAEPAIPHSLLKAWSLEVAIGLYFGLGYHLVNLLHFYRERFT